MNQKLRELFYVPKYGKVKEKAILARGAATLCAIVLCLAGMCFTAYAYFTADVSSNDNRIESAVFDLAVLVEAPAGEETPVISRLGRNYSAAFKANIPYRVILTRKGNAQTGFCVMKTLEGDYHTQQLGADHTVRNQPVEQISFTLILGADEVIIFQPHWGTSIHYPQYRSAADFYITHEEKITVGAVLPTAEPDLNEPESTQPAEPFPGDTEPKEEPAQTVAPTEDPTEPEEIPTQLEEIPTQPEETPDEPEEAPIEPDVEQSGEEQSDTPNEISP